jgi:hypothetical protein
METSTSGKRTVHLPDMAPNAEQGKMIYPRGIVSTVKEFTQDSKPVKRIELFAKKGEKTYGIIRTLSVAFTSARGLLQIAEASSNVVKINGLVSDQDYVSHGRSPLIEDKLVLKRAEDIPEESEKFRLTAPALIVSPRWRERMHLSVGDRLIVSNPLETYAVPPPSL